MNASDVCGEAVDHAAAQLGRRDLAGDVPADLVSGDFRRLKTMSSNCFEGSRARSAKGSGSLYAERRYPALGPNADLQLPSGSHLRVGDGWQRPRPLVR